MGEVCLQRRELGFGRRVLALRDAEFFHRLRARILQPCAFGLQCFQGLLRCLERGIDLCPAPFELALRGAVRLDERLQLDCQTFAPLGERLGGALEVRTIRLLEL